MRLLLDTQSFLWFIAGDTRLSTTSRKLIEDIDNIRLISTASIWEIAIKVGIGKLNLGAPFGILIPHQMTTNVITVLNITTDHATVVAGLPFHHNDPFDRMILAQALVEQIPIISTDAAFDAYGINRIW